MSSGYRRRGYFSWGDEIERQYRDSLPTAEKLMRAVMNASTFREDPLPERKPTDRNVTLPHVKWLDRPDP